jgi:hypothetical protein
MGFFVCLSRDGVGRPLWDSDGTVGFSMLSDRLPLFESNFDIAQNCQTVNPIHGNFGRLAIAVRWRIPKLWNKHGLLM